jgi:hypothetical protein
MFPHDPPASNPKVAATLATQSWDVNPPGLFKFKKPCTVKSYKFPISYTATRKPAALIQNNLIAYFNFLLSD